jgi:hypothetical protein
VGRWHEKKNTAWEEVGVEKQKKKKKLHRKKNCRVGRSYTPLGDGAYGKVLGPS